MNPVIAVQKLVVRWDKSGRGHPIASVRSALPSALELPVMLLDGPVAYHCVSFAQMDAFAPTVTTSERRATPVERDLGLSLHFEKDRLAVTYQWEHDCGAPRRKDGQSARLFDLRLGEVGRLIHNGRFSPEYSWTYQQVVFNVGIFTGPSVSVFLDLPYKEADLRAELW